MIGRLLARVPEIYFRVAGLIFFAGFLAWRLSLYSENRSRVVLWAAESSVYLFIALAYVRRVPAIERATKWYEIVLPPIGGVGPFALNLQEVPQGHAEVALALMLAGNALSVVSYAFLGGSFSILVEARPLVARGPYRWVRHPVYLGQIIATAGVVVLRFSRLNLGLWGGFVVIQVARAIFEERKLLQATPGYAEYRARTWMLLPPIV